MAESAQEKQARLDREALLAAVVHVCSSPQGRLVIWHLLELCHPNQTSFSTDPVLMAFREGERNIANYIGALIDEADPMIYMKLMQSAQENKRERIGKRNRSE